MNYVREYRNGGACQAQAPYDSPRRREQAAATRREILEAAQRLFERAGLRRDRRWRRSRPRPASRSRRSTSPSRPRAACCARSGTCSCAATTTTSPSPERAWYREVLEEPDPAAPAAAERAQLTRGQAARRRRARGDPQRRPPDPDIEALWNRIQSDFYDNQRAIVEGAGREERARARARRRRAPPTSSGRSTTPTCGSCSSRGAAGRPSSTSSGSATPPARSCSRARTPPDRTLLYTREASNGARRT